MRCNDFSGMLKTKTNDKKYVFRIVLFWINRECNSMSNNNLDKNLFRFVCVVTCSVRRQIKTTSNIFILKNRTNIFSSVRQTNDIHLYSYRTVHITCLHLKTKQPHANLKTGVEMLNLDWDKCLSRYEQRKVFLFVKTTNNYVLQYFYLIGQLLYQKNLHLRRRHCLLCLAVCFLGCILTYEEGMQTEVETKIAY